MTTATIGPQAASAPAALHDRVLRQVAGDTIFERGRAYASDQRVELIATDATSARALVHGTETYETTLRLIGGTVDGACTCPHAEDVDVCKHMVAVAITWRGIFAGAAPEASVAQDAPAALETGARSAKRAAKAVAASTASPAREGRGNKRAAPDLAAFVSSQPIAWLREQVLQAAANDPLLRQRLLLAASAQAVADDPKAMEATLSAALGSPGSLDYRGSLRFAQRLDAPLAELERLHAQGTLAAARAGCLYLLRRLLPLYARSDDSAGAIGLRLRALGELTQRVLSAQPIARPEVARFVDLLLADEWGILEIEQHGAWIAADALPAFDRELERRYDALPPLPPGGTRFSSTDDRFALQSWMQAIARRRGDVDAEVRLLTQAPDANALDNLRAAERLIEAGRDRQARQLLEAAIRRHDDDRLRLALAELHIADGAEDDAYALMLQAFARRPSCELFERLRRLSGAQWPQRRDAVYAQIDAAAPRANTSLGAGRGAVYGETLRDCTLRYRCLLLEDRVDEAAAVVRAGALPSHALERAACAFAPSHPDLAFDLLRAQVDADLLRSDARHYESAAGAIVAVCAQLPESLWRGWLVQLRAAQVRRPRLIAALDAAARTLAEDRKRRSTQG